MPEDWVQLVAENILNAIVIVLILGHRELAYVRQLTYILARVASMPEDRVHLVAKDILDVIVNPLTLGVAALALVQVLILIPAPARVTRAAPVRLVLASMRLVLVLRDIIGKTEVAKSH